MCYDISFTVDVRELVNYFPGLVYEEQLSINFDAAVHIMGHAYANHPVIFKDTKGDGQLHLKLMEWGCIPYYVKDENVFKKNRALMLNARSERILEDTKSYWYKIRSKRCLMPVTGIYEHREVKGIKKKVPYFVQLKEQSTFFIPGLYSVTELPDKETGEVIKRFTFTVITRAANEVMKMIHNGGENIGRMPLFVPLALANKWVKEEISEQEYRHIIDYEMPSKALNYHPVDTIRSPKSRADGKAKNEPFEWAGLPELSI